MQFGLVGSDELAAGHALHPAKPVKRVLTAANAPTTLSRGSFDRPPPAPAQFKPGDRVRTRNINPTGHTRLPRYARGHSGVVECVRGCHVFPDAVANGQGEEPRRERLPAVGRDLEAGGTGMPTEPDEEIAALLEGGTQIHRSIAPARGADHVTQVGSDDSRTTPVLGQSSRDERPIDGARACVRDQHDGSTAPRRS